MKTDKLMINNTKSMRLSKRARIVFLILFLSGFIWLVLHYLCNSVGEFGIMSHLLESKMLWIHGFAAFGFAFIFGNIWAMHVKFGIQKNIRKILNPV
jgi:hypothetical protein